MIKNKGISSKRVSFLKKKFEDIQENIALDKASIMVLKESLEQQILLNELQEAMRGGHKVGICPGALRLKSQVC